MCGIAGFTGFNGMLPAASEVVGEMCEVLTPRGPDGHGAFVDDSVALGHRRLSIIDIAGGAQPMETADGRFRITYNGEVYNYIELREELEAKGHSFATHSDTEVVLRQYMEDGVDCLKRFNGMFSFAIWDRDEGRLFLARDRMGIKPLHYACVNGELAFASEIKALLKHPGVSRDIDPLSLSKFLAFSYIPAPHTMFRNIRKLEPGTFLLFSKNGLTKEVYWDIPLDDNPISGMARGECEEDIRNLLRDSVKKRLRSDVPVGVFLSGGVDSSAITAFAAEATSGTLHTFSVGFEEASYDESPYAKQVAELFSTEHHHEILSEKTAVEMIPTVMGILDEPFGDPSILPTYLLSKFTSQHVKVALGGDGGDELFAGYPAFACHKITERLSILPTGVRDRIMGWAKKIPVSHSYASTGYLLQQFFKGVGISPEVRFFLWLGAFGNDRRRQILGADLRGQLARANPYEDIINYVGQSGLVSDFERLLYLCAKLYMQDGILVKVDRASMANSLEVRTPFLDHDFVSYVSRLPSSYKLRGLKSKFILKRAMQPILPKNIVHRQKAGFSIPVAKWMKNDLREMMEDLCTPASLSRDGLLDPVQVRFLLDEHYENRRDNRKEIWPLFAFLTWREQYGS